MLKTAKEILSNKKIQKFLISSLIILFLWVLFTIFFPIALHKMHFWAIYPQAHLSAWMLQLFGYSATVMHYVNNCMSLLDINHSSLVCIGTGCSGVELFLIFAVFILLFKGTSKNFLWYIPAGVLLISMLNVIRIMALSLIALYAPDYLDFNHKYTFTIIVYGFLIWLWLHWMNKYYIEE
jgi:exosortase family protein XrtF